MNEWMYVSTVPSKPVLQGQVEADPSPHFYHEPGNQNSFLNQKELITFYSNVQSDPQRMRFRDDYTEYIYTLFPYIHVNFLLSYSSHKVSP